MTQQNDPGLAGFEHQTFSSDETYDAAEKQRLISEVLALLPDAVDTRGFRMVRSELLARADGLTPDGTLGAIIYGVALGLWAGAMLSDQQLADFKEQLAERLPLGN